MNTLDQAVNPICGKVQDTVTVVYGARGRDLATFLSELDERYRNG